jgi:Cu(I)/Ag(I) efflux system protein CusF
MLYRNCSTPATAGLALLALAACANPTPSVASTSPDASMGIDLGPSSRVPRTQLAMAGAGRAMAAAPAAGPVQTVHEGGSDAHATGTVNKVDAAGHKVNLSHNPIPAIGWPAMTMDFNVAPSVDLSRVKPGTKVNFSIEKDKAGMYQIQSIEPAGGGR